MTGHGQTLDRRTVLSIALATLVGAAALAPSAVGAAAEGGQASAPPTRLWYRVSADITLKKTGDFTFASGVLNHYETSAGVRLRSRTAVLLYRQCTALAEPRFDSKLLARLTTLTRTTATCAEVRRYLRDSGSSADEIRRLRLVDDVRFAAKAKGLVNEFERKIDVAAHQTTTGGGAVVDCAAQTLDIRRITAPEAAEGMLRTASAARDGVSARIVFPNRLQHDAESGGEGGPCVIRADGKVVTMPRLVRGSGSALGVFGWAPAYGYVPSPAAVPFQIGRRFGRSFSVAGTQSSRESVANGTWVTTGRTVLRFTVCPRGGRDVASC